MGRMQRQTTVNPCQEMISAFSVADKESGAEKPSNDPRLVLASYRRQFGVDLKPEYLEAVSHLPLSPDQKALFLHEAIRLVDRLLDQHFRSAHL